MIDLKRKFHKLIYNIIEIQWMDLSFHWIDINIFSKFLKNKKFSCFSNNCWYVIKCQNYGMQYQSPTVGMTIDAESFIRLISHPDSYLGKEMVYSHINEYECIVGKIDSEYGPIFLGLVHYDTIENANKAWIKRSNRIDYSNLLIKFSDRWTTEDEMLSYCGRLSKLSYENKLVFTKYKSVYERFKNKEGFKVIYCPEYEWHDSTSEWKYDKYHFSVVKYFNRLKRK